MATPQVLMSPPNEMWTIPEGLPASEEPFEKGSKTIVPPKEEDSSPVKSSRRSTQIKPYNHKERRVTFHGDRRFRCVICEKSFSKKSSLLMHQRSHKYSKGMVGPGYGTTFGQKARLPICTTASLLKATNNVKSHVTKPGEDRKYTCQKCMKIFFLHENFIKHQKIHLPPEPAQSRAGNSWIDPKGKAEEVGKDHPELLLEELTKMRQNFDQLIVNQQSQLQVLQGIQRQLNILLPGNNLINSNVCILGRLLSQQISALRSISFSIFINPGNPLPESAPNLSS